jgi:hypothetical protein
VLVAADTVGIAAAAAHSCRSRPFPSTPSILLG